MADAEQYGPILPPATQTDVHVTIGPTLPPGYSKQESLNQEGSGTGDSSVEGGSSMDIGPMVSEMSHGDEVVQAAEEFERRSRKMKDHLTVKAEAEPGPSKREEWMTELPPEMSKNIGVTARTFSKGVGQDDKDRSEWTDTPAEKLKKEKESKGKKRKREEEKNPAKQRDLQLQHQVDEYNKKNRAESLVEMHQKSKKKKKKEEKKKKKKEKKKKKKTTEKDQDEPEKPSRLPFDRDRDLKANHFDDVQRKAIIKKSAQLHTRFQNSGATSSFL